MKIKVIESMLGKAIGIHTDERLMGRTYKIDEIASMVPISPESGRSLGGAAVGAVAGGLLLGPLAAVAGGLLGAGKSTVAVQVNLKNKKTFVGEMTTKDLIKCASALG